MEEGKKIRPPQWAENFLGWYCRPELLEDLQGDLNEYFERHLKTKGASRAKLIYVIDVFKFLRLYTIRKPESINLLIQWMMINSYLKTSGRNIVRNKLFSAINITGLAISMSVGLLLIGLLSDMFSYDRFHENRNRIYRVISKYGRLDHENSTFNASSSLRTGRAIAESLPGIDDIAVLRRGFEGDIQWENKIIPARGMWANEATLRVFTFPLLQGDASTALKEPFSLLLTESTAKKLFGDGEAIGKTLLRNGQAYVVTGVMKDLPVFSHLRFDLLASLSSREIAEADNPKELAWDNMWSTYTYLLLPENTDLTHLQNNLDALSKREDQTVKDVHIKLALQPLSEIALGKDLNNSAGPVMDSSVVWMTAILSLVVLLSACFNYTNLSIARSLRRSREVGIRKVVGALKGHVLGQFMVEAVVISLCALGLSFVLFILLRPYFLSLNFRMQEMLRLNLTPSLIAWFVLLAVVVGLAAGFFPALFFSRINAIKVLKNISAVRVLGQFNARKTLIVIQFTISIAFITATLIGYRQYKHLLSFDLGFQTENILNIRLQNNKPDLVVKTLSELPEVKQISKSAMVTSIGSYWGGQMKYINPQDSEYVYFNKIDENYLPLHGHHFLAGRNFNPQPANAEEKEVIVNEQVLKRFNIANRDPLKALDEIVDVDGRKMKIVGVLKDFHYGKLEGPIENVIFLYDPEEAGVVNLKISSTDIGSTMNKIEKAWHTIDHVHPLEATFYDDAIEHAYAEFSSMLKIIGFLAFLAICIASMGLLGMVVFATETRLKEMSIRKVMGASEGNLIYLQSRGFLTLLAVAAGIALPCTYFYFDRVVLSKIAYHAPISMSDLLTGISAILMIALLLIGSQTVKVARSNPAKVLKNE